MDTQEAEDSPPAVAETFKQVQMPQLALPLGLDLEVGWPDRTVAILSDALHEPLISVIERQGFVPVRLSPGRAASSIETLDPFTFLFVDASALDSPAAPTLLERLWERSPGARGILLFDDSTPPSSLVTALRAGITEAVDREDVAALEHTFTTQLGIAGVGRERVLAIGAHPDDVEIGCAGTLLLHRHRGDRISILTLSRGSVGGDLSARRQEAISTALAIGGQLMLGNLEDTRIDGGVDTIRLIEQVVRVLNPTTIYVHSAHDNHQDHRAVHAATVSAARSVARMFAYQSPSGTNDFQPTKFVPIDETIRTKVDVLGLFASQAERTYLEPEMITANARYWARQLAPLARYAEPFEVMRATDTTRHSTTAHVVVPEQGVGART